MRTTHEKLDGCGNGRWSVPVVLEALESKDVQHANGGLHFLPLATDVGVDRGYQPVEQLPIESFGKRISSIVRLQHVARSQNTQIPVDQAKIFSYTSWA